MVRRQTPRRCAEGEGSDTALSSLPLVRQDAAGGMSRAVPCSPEGSSHTGIQRQTFQPAGENRTTAILQSTGALTPPESLVRLAGAAWGSTVDQRAQGLESRVFAHPSHGSSLCFQPSCMILQLLCAHCGTLGQALGGFGDIFALFSSSPHCFDFLQRFSLAQWSLCPLPTRKVGRPERGVTCRTREGTVKSRHGCICANRRGRAFGGWEGADGLQVTSHRSSSMLPHCTPCRGAALPVPTQHLCCVCLQGGSSWPPFTALGSRVAARPRTSLRRCHVAAPAFTEQGKG